MKFVVSFVLALALSFASVPQAEACPLGAALKAAGGRVVRVGRRVIHVGRQVGSRVVRGC